MWVVHSKHRSASAAQQLAQMRRRLVRITEKEQILRERDANREASRYLLDARHVHAEEFLPESQTSNIARRSTGGGGDQLAA